VSNQTLADRIDILYEARLRNPENPEMEISLKDAHGRLSNCTFISDVLNSRFYAYLKPKTVTREITHPEPLRDAPEHRTTLYRAAPEISVRYELVLWHGLDYQAQWLLDGLLHSTQEAAVAHGKALAGVSDGK